MGRFGVGNCCPIDRRRPKPTLTVAGTNLHHRGIRRNRRFDLAACAAPPDCRRSSRHTSAARPHLDRIGACSCSGYSCGGAVDHKPTGRRRRAAVSFTDTLLRLGRSGDVGRFRCSPSCGNEKTGWLAHLAPRSQRVGGCDNNWYSGSCVADRRGDGEYHKGRTLPDGCGCRRMGAATTASMANVALTPEAHIAGKLTIILCDAILTRYQTNALFPVGFENASLQRCLTSNVRPAGSQ